MVATNRFFVWFLYGLREQPLGIGGWVIFLLLAIAAVIWLLYNSGSRRLPALGWRMAVVFTALLLMPVLLYRFSTDPCIIIDPGCDPSPLAPYREILFYLGVLGGVLPVVLAVGYYVTFQGLSGCPRGLHGTYETVLGQCPGCALLDNPVAVRVGAVSGGGASQGAAGGTVVPGTQAVAPVRPQKRKVQAWLTAPNGKNFQLCENETTIGREDYNDIYLTGDSSVSREHAKIIERNGRFRLMHVSAKSKTRVNGQLVREPALLSHDDEIRFGENTVLRFVAPGA